MDIEARLREREGCARTSELVRGAVGRSQLRALVEAGQVRRVRRGLYALPGADEGLIAARSLTGAVTCVSVAERLDLPLLRPPAGTHVALPPNRAVPVPGLAPAGTVLHWDSAVRRSGMEVHLPVAAALAHVVACLPAREAVAVLDAAVGRGLVAPVDLAAHRPRGGSVAFERLLRSVDGRSQSLPESFARTALVAAGLSVEPQVTLRGVGRVDLLVADTVVVEVDGWAFHTDRAQFREDRRRDRVLHTCSVCRCSVSPTTTSCTTPHGSSRR